MSECNIRTPNSAARTVLPKPHLKRRCCTGPTCLVRILSSVAKIPELDGYAQFGFANDRHRLLKVIPLLP